MSTTGDSCRLRSIQMFSLLQVTWLCYSVHVEQWNPCDLYKNLLDGVRAFPGIWKKELVLCVKEEGIDSLTLQQQFPCEQLIAAIIKLRQATVSIRKANFTREKTFLQPIMTIKRALFMHFNDV